MYNNYVNVTVCMCVCVCVQGLVVPVVRNVENMSFAQIEIAVHELGLKVCYYCS